MKILIALATVAALATPAVAQNGRAHDHYGKDGGAAHEHHAHGAPAGRDHAATPAHDSGRHKGKAMSKAEIKKMHERCAAEMAK